MSNFTCFLSAPHFVSFAEVAVTAEKVYAIDPAACVLNCRRSLEFARQMDVLREWRIGHALRRPDSLPHGDRGFPGHRGSGPVAAPQVHQPDG